MPGNIAWEIWNYFKYDRSCFINFLSIPCKSDSIQCFREKAQVFLKEINE